MHVSSERLLTLISQDLLEVHYQPIMTTDRTRLVGYEALTRVKAEGGELAPTLLFAAAEHWGLRQRLECHTRQMAVRGFTWSPSLLLFLNYHPGYACDFARPDCRTCPFARAALTVPQQLVLELPENALGVTKEELCDAVENARAFNLGIGLDDFGSGQNGLAALLRIRPEWVKLDRSLVTKLPFDPWHRAVVGQISGLQSALNIRLVAEGVETEAEQAALQALGIPHIQGFLVGYPAPFPPLGCS